MTESDLVKVAYDAAADQISRQPWSRSHETLTPRQRFSREI